MEPVGRLAVPGAQEIVDNLAELTTFAVDKRIPIIATADSHVEKDAEFKDFSPHCVIGTPGQAKIRATKTANSQVADMNLLNRQVQLLLAGELSQLVIEISTLDMFAERISEKIVRAINPYCVYVYGVATEFCVRLAVLGFLLRNYRLKLIIDAIKPIEQTAGLKAIEEMKKMGAVLTTTAETLKDLSLGLAP